MSLIANPIQRVLSDLHPLANILGCDSGLLIPDRTYRYIFTQAGVYTYQDGLGRTAVIVVLPPAARIFLPVIRR